ncbi:tyrosine-type recombinase/integrase [Tunturibacter empetritectus]|uniref:Site-specific recombinase XerD n=1 Tax=Tunturiibacter lichenicola TaxID=2051959 RepID=A0A7W8N3Y2_9BACT|nr:site-specific integrase [Edaphobacter lichenicola]MBB5343923.1 site-specific recombinase XerD [Edaphobacter lichenicola]
MAQTVAVNRSKYEGKQPLKQPLFASDEPPSKRGRQAPKPVRGVFEHPPNSGIWWVNYYVDGKRHREKVGTRKAASDLYSKRKNDARMGVKLPDSLKAKRAVLFEELAKDAMEYSKAHKKSHRGDISNLSSLLPVFGKMKAEEITPQTISAYFSTRTDLKPASINRYRSTMSMIFAEGIRNGKVTANPARLVRLRKENNARLRFITFDEEAQIRSIIRRRCPVHEPDFTVAIETGMRLSEQHSLEWPDVHLNRQQIQLVATKNGSSRVVILSKEAVEALKVCQTRRMPHTPRVFLTRYGEPMENPRAWFRLVMEDAVKQNKQLADVTWHVFRHTYISRLVMAGVDLRTVQELAGHKDISMTTRYAHLSPDHKLSAVAKLSSFREQSEARQQNITALHQA